MLSAVLLLEDLRNVLTVCCLPYDKIWPDTKTQNVPFRSHHMSVQCLSPLLSSPTLSQQTETERSPFRTAPIVTYADHVAAMLGRTHLDGRDGTLLVACSSPSRNRTTATVALDTSTNSSPGSDRVKAIRQSPNWRPTEVSLIDRSGNRGTTFVRRSGREADDVFGSPSHAQVAQSSCEGRSALHKFVPPSR